MTDQHVGAWISAYYDGELSGARRQQVEEHLRDCENCRSELESLQRLSTWLRLDPDPVSPIAVETFRAAVTRRLDQPGRTAYRASRPGAIWLSVPFGLVAAWVFLQVAVFLAGLPGKLIFEGQLTQPVVSLANIWIALPGLFGLSWLNALLEAFNWTGLGLQRFSLSLLNISLTFLITALLWAWVAGWWAFQRSVKNSQRRFSWITSKS